MYFKVSNRGQKLLVTFLAGALGNLLAYLSTMLLQLQPQVALDLSHISTFAIALYFGPYYGLLAGAVVAIYPYIEFGMLGVYGPLLGLAVIVGKAMTGYFAGMLVGRVRPYLAVALAFIPESLFTFIFLTSVNAWFIPGALPPAEISDILLKGWVEILVMSFIFETLVRREIIEVTIILTEIFIVALLIEQHRIGTLAVLLAIVLITMTVVDIVRQHKKTKHREYKTKE
jgi:hypothetical protein